MTDTTVSDARLANIEFSSEATPMEIAALARELRRLRTQPVNEPAPVVTDALISARRMIATREHIDELGWGKGTSPATPILKKINAALSALTKQEGSATHRHKKRGSEYVLIGYGKMQAENWGDLLKASDTSRFVPTVDMREVAIYRDVSDNSLWVRPKEEFEDGRFIPLSPGDE